MTTEICNQCKSYPTQDNPIDEWYFGKHGGGLWDGKQWWCVICQFSDIPNYAPKISEIDQIDYQNSLHEQ